MYTTVLLTPPPPPPSLSWFGRRRCCVCLSVVVFHAHPCRRYECIGGEARAEGLHAGGREAR